MKDDERSKREREVGYGAALWLMVCVLGLAAGAAWMGRDPSPRGERPLTLDAAVKGAIEAAESAGSPL